MARSKQTPAIRGRLSRTANSATPLQTAKKSVNAPETIHSAVSSHRRTTQSMSSHETFRQTRKPAASKQIPKAQSPRKRTRRNNHTTPALREISKLQQTAQLLISKAPIYRVVREIMQNVSSNRETKRITCDALTALHEASEAFLTGMFEQSNMLAMHGKRVTVMVRDISLWQKLHSLPV
uniref:Histone domain-containing protein n=1 Tax=Rhabditophanes sp. KR3021 TaxID=114890 RepID=A0AC35TY28_9BILA